ncbi:hypothetical protein [Mycoplasma sp. Mirounga ES2805-ORL]|uniref:hypothetical protein n=1 Tax=Mycoplasma sp. Mirounga ES2805-ORL TaxID=754514 RepID=UPI00197C8312|nr:hypothetical protein [Mycoplasma sp. Mirounga ES2805-ORL]QSF13679.1 hypothetical protein JXZ90_00010 [Mycoplasma sp. Mirounga ES2805-ORL]
MDKTSKYIDTENIFDVYKPVTFFIEEKHDNVLSFLSKNNIETGEDLLKLNRDTIQNNDTLIKKSKKILLNAYDELNSSLWAMSKTQNPRFFTYFDQLILDYPINFAVMNTSYQKRIIEENNINTLSQLHDFNCSIVGNLNKLPQEINNIMSNSRLITRDILELIKIKIDIYQKIFSSIFSSKKCYYNQVIVAIVNGYFDNFVNMQSKPENLYTEKINELSDEIISKNCHDIIKQHLINSLSIVTKFKNKEMLLNEVKIEFVESMNQIIQLSSIDEIKNLWKIKEISILDIPEEDLENDENLNTLHSFFSEEKYKNSNWYSNSHLKTIKSTYKFKEDRYSYIYTKYNISPREIMDIFNTSEMEMYYLKKFYEKGTQNIEEYILDPNISHNEKDKIKKFLLKNKKLIYLKGDFIKVSMSEILEMLMKKHSENHIKSSQIITEYNDFIYNNIFDKDVLNNLLPENLERNIEATLMRNNNVLLNMGKLYRYYELKKYNWQFFVDNINFEKYNGMFFSSKLIFDEYYELMQEYNIYNEYDLHNILRKLENNDMLPEGFHCDRRMPNLKYNIKNQEEQVINFFEENAPISYQSFWDLYSEKYGFNLLSMKGSSYPNILSKWLTKDRIYKKKVLATLQKKK